MIEFNKPVRILGEFHGDKRRYAVMYQDLKTGDFEVQRTHEGFKDGFKTVHSKIFDAENTAIEWVMGQ